MKNISLFFVLIFLFPCWIFASSSLECGEYELTGELSKDLKQPPVLISNALNGIPIKIELNYNKKSVFQTISLRGKKVKTKIQIVQILGLRTFKGEIKEIELDILDPLEANKIHLIKKTKCS